MRGVVIFVALAITQWAPWILGAPLGQPAGALLGAALFVGVLWAAVHATSGSDWGLSPARPAPQRLARGFTGGILTYALVTGVRWWVGGGTLTLAPATEIAGILLAAVAIAAYQAFSEEVVFRGAVFTLLPPRVPIVAAVAISTVLFVAFHLPRWEALVSGPYAIHLVLAGIAFVLAYLRTGSIWLGTGLHLGWNLGAELVREGDPPLLRLVAALPEGWGGWSAWVSVVGNGILLLLALALSAPRRREVVDTRDPT